jgi:hypothetical protein
MMETAGWMKGGSYDYGAFRRAMGVDISLGPFGTIKDVGRIQLMNVTLNNGRGASGFRHQGRSELWINVGAMRAQSTKPGWENYFKSQVVHEFAHIWDDSTGRKLSGGMAGANTACGCGASDYANYEERGGKKVPRAADSPEKWAEGVAALVYPDVPIYSNTALGGMPAFDSSSAGKYVQDQFKKYR